MQAVKDILLNEGITSVADLGCGDGAFIELIQGEPCIQKISGVDTSPVRLEQAKRRLSVVRGFHKVQLLRASFLDASFHDETYDAAVMVESIEHAPEEYIPELEQNVFGRLAPKLIVVTTPDATNRLTEEQMRQRGHFFEWDIPEFARWADTITGTYPYQHEISQLNGPTFVRGTQIATFKKTD